MNLVNRVLIDTSYLVALSDARDKYHVQALAFAENNRRIQIVPEVVLTEATYLIIRSRGILGGVRFLDRLVSARTILQSLDLTDLARARTIMATYRDAEFDFVDCCLMALAERLIITEICTLDRRDFSIFRPTHCEYLVLLP